MFKQQIYTMIANEFATPIGIAEIIAPSIDDPQELVKGLVGEHEFDLESKDGREAYKKMNEELRINRITLEAIRKNKYQQLTRGVYRAKMDNPKWSDRRAYSHTWRQLNINKVNHNNG